MRGVDVSRDRDNRRKRDTQGFNFIFQFTLYRQSAVGKREDFAHAVYRRHVQHFAHQQTNLLSIKIGRTVAANKQIKTGFLHGGSQRSGSLLRQRLFKLLVNDNNQFIRATGKHIFAPFCIGQRFASDAHGHNLSLSHLLF
ncbi:hypothetical protein SDC9_191536 [bioreactor metagenome]|uniref:Uncharacterized protein n=1 Tax=bioreactor metagenome TaxID=1076179 RepID=A0A645HY53_9ZZZZ